MKTTNKEYTSPLVKIHKTLLQVILGIIIIGLVSAGTLSFIYFRDITRLNALVATLKEKEYQFQALQFMKDTIPSIKGSIENSRKKLFTKDEVAVFQKTVPQTLLNLGFGVSNVVIGPEEIPEPGNSEIAYQNISLSLRGSEKSFLSFANYLEVTMPKEVRLTSLNLARQDKNTFSVNLVLLVPYRISN